MEKSYYAIIPANVRYDRDLTPNAKLLYGEITALTNEKGYCWASNLYFAELYGVSKKSISKWINQLVNKGYIQTRIIYKGDTKEIYKRYITIVFQMPIEEKFHTYGRKVQEGMEEKFNTPMEEKVKENNTIFNNTINNTIDNTISKDIVSSTKVQPIIDAWNLLELQKIISIKASTNRYKLLNARIKEFGEDQVLKAIENISTSSFLRGQNDKGWTITFDWLIKPNNFIKVLEGNYTDKDKQTKQTTSAKNEKPPLRFNNFEAREYDYDSLEKKLLGWDNED